MERTYRVDGAGKALIGNLQISFEVSRHHRLEADSFGDHFSILGDWRELRLVDLDLLHDDRFPLLEQGVGSAWILLSTLRS